MIFPKISDIYTGHLLLCPRTELTQFSLLGRHIFFKILSQFKANTISTRGCTEDFFSEKNPSIPLKVKVLSINHFVYSTDNILDRWFMLHKKQFDKKVDLWHEWMKHGERDPYLITDLEKNDETDVCS